jgi:hypothetical protein
MYEKRVNQSNGKIHPNLDFRRLSEEAELIHHSVGDEIEIRLVGGELHVRVPEHVVVTNEIKHYATTVTVVGEDGVETLVSHKRPREGSHSMARLEVDDPLEFPYKIRESLFWSFGEDFAQYGNVALAKEVIGE